MTTVARPLALLLLSCALAACGTPQAPTADSPSSAVSAQKAPSVPAVSGAVDVRYGVNGVVDLTGLGWVVGVDDGGGVVLGTVTATGTELRRVTPGGTLDRRFGRQGVWTFASVKAVALGTAGRVSTLTQDGPTGPVTVRRYRPNGQLDRSFGARGVVTDSRGRAAWGLKVLSDDRVMIGYTGGIAQVRPDGTPDPTFGVGGYRAGNRWMAITPNGNFARYGLSQGETSYDAVALVEVESNSGDRRNSVTYDAVRFASEGNEAVWPDGAVAYSFNDVGGAQPVVLLVTLEKSVTLYPDYDAQGIGIAAVPDGRIITYGTWSAGRLARYHRDGTLDTTFGQGGWSLGAYRPDAVWVQPDGGVLVRQGNALTRVHP